jgi:L-amino acid N-acyltransferase YncA
MTATTPLSATDPDARTALYEASPYKPYRQYRTYSRREQTAILAAEADAVLAAAGEFSVARGVDGDLRAAVLARPLPWDSAYFGVPMGRLDLVVRADTTAPEREAVVAAAVDAARAGGIRHLTARVDVADLESLAMLESQGFRTMDALATYILRRGRDEAREVRAVGPLRPATADDAEAVIAITREAYQGYRGRFHLDPHLPADRADGFYEEWARQCLAGTMADVVMVSADSGGRVIGYLAHRRREPASSIGTPIYGGGLGACRRDAPGAYASLIRDSALWAHGQGAVAECQTQLANFPVIRVYESVGFHFVRAEYTLHAWLG